ncbi:hypothetical protein ACI1US_01266 [Leucobacter sp. BZR 635]
MAGATSTRIADELRARILSGTMPPGTRIRQEQIAEEFGVSRLPIRESLRILEASGLITLVPSTGAWVSSLNLAECQEIYLIRERVEPLLLGLAVPHHTAESIAKFEHLAIAVETAESVEEFLDFDRRFHLATFEGPALPQLRAMVDQLWNTTQHYRRAYIQLTWPDGMDQIFMEHRLLRRAITVGDVTGAEALMAMHIRNTRIALENHPEIFADAPGK